MAPSKADSEIASSPVSPGSASGQQQRAKTDAEVYDSESRAAAKAAEDRWNERIKAAYASVAASTPFRPKEETAPKASRAVATSALSYARCVLECLIGLPCPPGIGAERTELKGTSKIEMLVLQMH